MTDFKVGDKVRVTNIYGGTSGNRVGAEGTIKTVRAGGEAFNVKVENKGRSRFGQEFIFYPKELELVKPETKFQVGDWVKVHGRTDKWNGIVGTVQNIKHGEPSFGDLYTVHKNDVGDEKKQHVSENVLHFFERQLEAAEAPSKFKVGDLVTFAEPDNERWRGGKAEVITPNGKECGRFTTRVRIIEGPPLNTMYADNYGHELNFDPAHLEAWEATEAPKPDFAKLYSYAEFDAKYTAKVLGKWEEPKPAPLKIYLAGPMSGIEHYNFPAFFTATRKLRAAGHEVFNPAENDLATGFNALGMEGHEAAEHGFSLRDALKTDLTWICEHADALVLLEGWESSKGVRAEMALAEALGLPKYEMERLPAAVVK